MFRLGLRPQGRCRIVWRAATPHGIVRPHPGESRPLPNPPLISLDRVVKRFPGNEAAAVCEVSFDAPAGALVALVGGSGSGKTTTLKCINRLIEPDAGEIRIEGRRNDAVDAVTLRRGIGYVFQNIGLFPHMTVAENIAVTPRLLGWTPAEIQARVSELLDLVALPSAYAGRSPDALSGGQRQRVGVARALAARPRIVLMDEPFGALDPLTREDLGQAYRALHERLGLTTVMVTHDVQEALLLADRIVVMRAGRVAADDTPRALLAGHPDPDVAALMAAPRRQAERVQALLGGAK
jgi:osmoprotectant transport system ATP-binding protein